MLQNPDPADWLMWRRTLDSWGHSPLDQIDTGNVANLRLVWTRALGPGMQEGTPLVYDGVMYFPNPSDVVQAIVAATGDVLWDGVRRARPGALRVPDGASRARAIICSCSRYRTEEPGALRQRGVFAHEEGGYVHTPRVPDVTGVLFELPQVVAEVTHPPSRLEPAAGDFFVDPLPAADIYVLMDLLHDWPDDDAARILAAVRRAASVDARVLLVEALIAEDSGRKFGKVLDVIMLATTGGRERTAMEHDALLAKAGFRLERVISTRSQYAIVEAIAH